MAAIGGSDGGNTNRGDDTPSSSPKNRVKFLCSHGGKILPRPADGQLKYVGGETRVVAVPRDINFTDLTKKLSASFDEDMILKYQLFPEDLDALVSVRTDEDLKHMFDEYDRYKSDGTPKLRAFLFPADPIIIENQTPSLEPHAIEQRYIDAINGIVRAHSPAKLSRKGANGPIFSISSAGSSPKSSSPDGHTAGSVAQESTTFTNSRFPMHNVLISPTLCSLSSLQQQSNGPGNHHIHQHHYQYYHNQQNRYQSSRPRPTLESYRSSGSERLARTLSMIRTNNNNGRGRMGHGLNYYFPASRHHKGSGCCNHSGYYEEYGGYSCARLDRTDSLPRSPRKAFWE